MNRFWKHPVFWGVVATSAIFLFGLWIGMQEFCTAADDCKSKYSAFLVARPNEIGDTLAGFAGALAFVWIIVTVWLQSQELSAQREELRLTRLEMKEQREATQDMARSMSAQATIFEAEARQREEDRAEALLNENLRSLIVAIDEASTKGLGWHFSNDVFFEGTISNGEVHSYYLGDQGTATKTIDEAVLELRRRLRGTHDHLWELVHTSVDFILPQRDDSVPDFIRKIDAILAIQDKLSPSQSERLTRMRLQDIQSEMAKLMETKEFWLEAVQ